MKKYAKFFNKILYFFILSLIFYLSVSAIPETDPYGLSDRLIQAVYYSGKKTSKITYDDIYSRVHNISEREAFEEYYTSYRKEFEMNKRQILEKINTLDKNLLILNKTEERLTKLIQQTMELNKRIQFKTLGIDIGDDFSKLNKQNVLNDNSDQDKSEFSKNLYSLYGNRTIFLMELLDLERLVNSSVLTDGQAVMFWESLLQIKTDRLKYIFGKSQNELDTEYYLFNCIPLKAIGFILLTCVGLLFMHKIQINFLKNSFILTFFLLLLTYYIVEYLYLWKYYLSSSIMFIQLGFSFKYFTDSIFYSLGFNKEDYDILMNISKTRSLIQFILKSIVLFLITFGVGFFCFKFPYFLNYILFYICFIQLVYLISFYLQYEVSSIFQPLKHFMLILVGILNFIFTKFHKKINKFHFSYSNTNTLSNEKVDSFYLVSEIFSFICISYFYDYLFTQANSISHLFNEKNFENEEMNLKISSIVKNYKEQQKCFTLDDSLWIIVFICVLGFGWLGLFNNNYLNFYFSLHLMKMVLKVFGRLFKVKILRIINCILIFLLVLENQIISSKNDSNLFELLGFTFSTPMNLIKFICKVIGVFYVFIYVFVHYEFIYVNEKKNEMDDEDENRGDPQNLFKKVEITASFDKKKKKKIKSIEIQLLKEDKPKINLMNLLYVHIDFFLNFCIICLIYYLIKEVEKNYFIIFLYGLIISIMMIRVNIKFFNFL